MAMDMFGSSTRPGADLYGAPTPDGQRWDRFKWGGQDRDQRGGLYVPGTSGVEQDVNRYRSMGDERYNVGGPDIDRTQSGQSRGYQTDGLGLMRNAAYGGAPSRAEIYGQKLTDDSIDAQMAMAASARGGTTAQAGAARHAAFQGAETRAAGARDLAAMRADEMARARGDYFGASSGMRGQDMAGEHYATDNEFRQRQLNAQQQQYYEQMGWNTRKQEQDATLQREKIGNDAWYQGRDATMKDEQNTYGKVKDIVGGVGSFIGGLVSDIRGKEDIYPIDNSLPVRKNPYGEPSRPHGMSSPNGQSANEPNLMRGFNAGISAFSGGNSGAYMPALSDARSKYIVSDDRAKLAAAFEAGRRAGPERDDGRELAGAFVAGERATGPESIYRNLEAAGVSKPKPKESRSGGRGTFVEGERALSEGAIHKNLQGAGWNDPMSAANRAMAGSAYIYKPEMTPPDQAPGERNVGPMAQSMAAHPITATAVKKDPQTGMLAIDRDKALKVTMSGLASVQQQLDALRAQGAR